VKYLKLIVLKLYDSKDIKDIKSNDTDGWPKNISLFIMGVFKNTGVVGIPPPLGESVAPLLYMKIKAPTMAKILAETGKGHESACQPSGSPDLSDTHLAIMPLTPYAGRCWVVDVVMFVRKKEIVNRLRNVGERPPPPKTTFPKAALPERAACIEDPGEGAVVMVTLFQTYFQT